MMAVNHTSEWLHKATLSAAAANAAQREGGMVFALISYSATIVGNATP